MSTSYNDTNMQFIPHYANRPSQKKEFERIIANKRKREKLIDQIYKYDRDKKKIVATKVNLSIAIEINKGGKL